MSRSGKTSKTKGAMLVSGGFVAGFLAPKKWLADLLSKLGLEALASKLVGPVTEGLKAGLGKVGDAKELTTGAAKKTVGKTTGSAKKATTKKTAAARKTTRSGSKTAKSAAKKSTSRATKKTASGAAKKSSSK